jgi:hypothetical protein
MQMDEETKCEDLWVQSFVFGGRTLRVLIWRPSIELNALVVFVYVCLVLGTVLVTGLVAYQVYECLVGSGV